MSGFEIVHTVTDYYDGPRGGIADFRGEPHIYESTFEDATGYTNIYRLSPVTDSVFQLALEDWAIWLRWEAAFHRGETTQDTHPALPADRERHEELQRLLHGELTIDDNNFVRATAEFRVRQDGSWSGYGMRPLEACWSPLPAVA
jgi:hypothetical protein